MEKERLLISIASPTNHNVYATSPKIEGSTQVTIEESAQVTSFLDGRESSEVCERLLRLGLSIIPEELQKECETIAEESPDWVELFKRFLSYVQWHKEVHARIANNQTTLQETRTLTYNCDIFKTCTGLGATVKAIATGVLTAMYTKRFFVADQLSFQAASQWADPVQPNAIHWEVETPSWDSLQDKANVSSHVVSASGNTSNAHVFYRNIRFGEFFCKDLPQGEWNSATNMLCQEGMKRNFSGFLNRRHEHFLFGTTIRAALKFSTASNKRAAEKLMVLRKKGLPASGYLAAHLRTGLEEKVGKRTFVRTGKFMQDYAKWTHHIDCALQKANASGFGGPILLVTDSSVCREWTRAHYSTKDVLVTSSSFFHFSKEAQKLKNAEVTKTTTVIDMVSEMVLLSQASHLVLSAMSSFSEVAFHFSALSQSQVSQC